MRCLAFLLLLACRASAADQVTIAAAANLSEVFPAVGRAFESASGIHAVFSFGSTSQLSQQIENGAPFDVFAAADTVHIDQLIDKNLLIRNSRAVYATGVLALWFPSGRWGSTADLGRPAIRAIAIANPELAPYGKAAVETLRKLGMFDQVKAKIVNAANISMAKQYGASGNAEAVFTALSLVLKERGTVIQIDESLHQPVTQALATVTATKNRKAAAAFVSFLFSPEGRKILRDYGYR